MNNLNMSVHGLDVCLECAITNWFFASSSAYNKIRLLLKDNSIKTFREFVDVDCKIVKSMRRQIDGSHIFEVLQYIKYRENNGDCDLVEVPTQWDDKYYGNWKENENLKFVNPTPPHWKVEDNRIESWRRERRYLMARTMALPSPPPPPLTTTTTTTTALDIVWNKGVISNETFYGKC